MANDARKDDATGASPTPASEALGSPVGASGGKRPYAPPQLRSLGKVAELTFGPHGTTLDGVGGTHGPKG
jgi:hypothetical protein